MKRCPTCNRTFTDPNLSFCIEDGTPLIVEAVSGPDPEATMVSPAGREQTAAAGELKAPEYQPPPNFPPPPAAVPRRKLWPWVIGFLALLLLVLVGLGIAAAIIVPSMMKEAQNRNVNRSSSPANINTNSNANANANTGANTNSFPANENTNTNTNDNDNTSGNSAPPTDREVVLNDLKNIEDEWTVANLNADKKKLEKILADDYVGTQSDRSMQGKAQYLRDIKPDKSVQHWEFQNLKLELVGSRATLTGLVSLERKGEDALVLNFTDKFVWRDGRWQAVSSEVSPVKESKN